MAKGKKAKDGNDKKAAEDKLELDIINRIVLFYTSKDTTHEQRLKVWEALEGIYSAVYMSLCKWPWVNQSASSPQT
jgi:hypothetical protein